MKPAVEMLDITKRFARVVANDHADFRVQRGTIHALMGENGAGKTTLMNILFGHYQPDGGKVLIDGRRVRWNDPGQAMAAGLGMVHQEFTLLPPLSVAENVVLGKEPRRRGFLFDSHAARRAVKELASAAGFSIDPTRPVSSLTVGLKQRVEILKALWREAHILILDEPTSVLSPPESEELFRLLRSLKAQGTTIILISHRVPEVLGLADYVTVMRRGRTIAEIPVRDLTAPELVTLMVGNSEEATRPAAPVAVGPPTHAPLVELRAVSVKGERGSTGLHDLSMSLNRGEIHGVAAIEGNGALELAELLAGLLPPSQGSLNWEGVPWTDSSPLEARRRGISFLPGDREGLGLFLPLSLEENLILGRHRFFSRYGWLMRSRMATETRRLITHWDIVPPEPKTPVKELSGGNRQRVILARELAGKPRLIVAVHPTRGLDWEGQQAVRRALESERRRGCAILLISADLGEILSLADNVMALYRGRVAGEWPRGEVSESELGIAMTGSLSPKPRPARPGPETRSA